MREDSVAPCKRADVIEAGKDDRAPVRHLGGCLRAALVLELAGDDECRRGDPTEERPRRPAREALEAPRDDLSVGLEQVLEEPGRDVLVTQNRREPVRAHPCRRLEPPSGIVVSACVDGSLCDECCDAPRHVGRKLVADARAGGVAPEHEAVQFKVVAERDHVGRVFFDRVPGGVDRCVARAVAAVVEQDKREARECIDVAGLAEHPRVAARPGVHNDRISLADDVVCESQPVAFEVPHGSAHPRLHPVHSLDDLRRRHRGPVIAPGDEAYDAARMTFNGMLDRRPELIAQPLDGADVVAAVSFAAQSGVPVAVRGGGHGVAGHCVGDGSLVVDLRLMRNVEVDPDSRTATCGGGTLWDDIDPACQRHGLATPGGTFGDTGVAGLTLGGGIGHLSPSFGLTLDNLLSARIVTAEGEVVSASEEEHPDLFWALRGGGGNFGVVTSFTFRLHPVGLLLGGKLDYRLEDAPRVLPAWRDLMAKAPDRLASFGQIYRDGDTGEGLVNASVGWLGDLDEGRDAIRELTGGLAPTRNTVRPMYYSELQSIYGRVPFGLRNYWSGRFLRELPDEALELTIDRFLNGEVTGGVLIEPLHGAAARVPPEATAFAGREARWNATFINVWVDPEEDERQIENARAFSRSLEPWALGGGYLNYASEAAGDSLESEFGAGRFGRLQSVKRQYDPENAFRFNHNIPPPG